MPNEAIASRAKSQEWCGRLPNRGSADPETDDVVADELSRKDLLKSVALLGGVGAVAACTPSKDGQVDSGVLGTASDAAGIGDPVVSAGDLFDVRNASGIRAGVHGPQTERLQTSQRSFKVEDAYRDPGHWFFYYDSDGIVLATRNYITKNSGKSVCYSLAGFRTVQGPQLTTSLGQVTFAATDEPGEVRCHVMTTSSYRAASQTSQDTQQSSPFFVSAQELRIKDKSTLDSKLVDTINSVIDRSANQLGLNEENLHRLAD